MLTKEKFDAINSIKRVIRDEGSLEAAIAFGIDDEITTLGLDIQLASYEKSRSTLESSLEKLMNTSVYDNYVTKHT